MNETKFDINIKKGQSLTRNVLCGDNSGDDELSRKMRQLAKLVNKKKEKKK